VRFATMRIRDTCEDSMSSSFGTACAPDEG
jgi:hypothetical protein